RSCRRASPPRESVIPRREVRRRVVGQRRPQGPTPHCWRIRPHRRTPRPAVGRCVVVLRVSYRLLFGAGAYTGWVKGTEVQIPPATKPICTPVSTSLSWVGSRPGGKGDPNAYRRARRRPIRRRG